MKIFKKSAVSKKITTLIIIFGVCSVSENLICAGNKDKSYETSDSVKQTPKPISDKSVSRTSRIKSALDQGVVSGPIKRALGRGSYERNVTVEERPPVSSFIHQLNEHTEHRAAALQADKKYTAATDEKRRLEDNLVNMRIARDTSSDKNAQAQIDAQIKKHMKEIDLNDKKIKESETILNAAQQKAEALEIKAQKTIEPGPNVSPKLIKKQIEYNNDAEKQIKEADKILDAAHQKKEAQQQIDSKRQEIIQPANKLISEYDDLKKNLDEKKATLKEAQTQYTKLFKTNREGDDTLAARKTVADIQTDLNEQQKKVNLQKNTISEEKKKIASAQKEITDLEKTLTQADKILLPQSSSTLKTAGKIGVVGGLGVAGVGVAGVGVAAAGAIATSQEKNSDSAGTDAITTNQTQSSGTANTETTFEASSVNQ